MSASGSITASQSLFTLLESSAVPHNSQGREIKDREYSATSASHCLEMSLGSFYGLRSRKDAMQRSPRLPDVLVVLSPKSRERINRQAKRRLEERVVSLPRLKPHVFQPNEPMRANVLRWQLLHTNVGHFPEKFSPVAPSPHCRSVIVLPKVQPAPPKPRQRTERLWIDTWMQRKTKATPTAWTTEPSFLLS